MKPNKLSLLKDANFEEVKNSYRQIFSANINTLLLIQESSYSVSKYEVWDTSTLDAELGRCDIRFQY